MHNYAINTSHVHLITNHINSTTKLNQRIWNVE